MTRKDAELVFKEFNVNGKNVWMIHKIMNIPTELFNVAIRLAALDFIKFVRITDDSISASNEIEGMRIKIPVTKINHPSAIGIKIVFYYELKIFEFYEINSPIKGNGCKMVDSVFADFPLNWQATVVMDWSYGFWDKMKERYDKINWTII
jgi:hypothetical protein